MKALLLVYIGKDVQGLQLAKEVVAGRPTDLSTLGNLDKVFVIANDCTPYNLAGIKNLDKTSVSMFEDAFKVSPLEDIGALWFFSVLRTQDMKSLFSVALNLRSIFKNIRYMFWAVLALHLQAKLPKNQENWQIEYNQNSMKLAENMVFKAFLSEKTGQRTLEELLLLIMTTQSTGNHQEALLILKQASGIPFPNIDERNILQADLLEKSGRFDEAIEYAEGILKQRGIFDWTVWKLYVKAIEKSDQCKELLSKIRELWNAIEPITDKRSFLLAKIDAAIVFKDSLSNEQMAEEIVNYIKEFQDKDCCVPDTQHIAGSLPEKVLQLLLDHFQSQFVKVADDSFDYLTWAVLERLFALKLVQMGSKEIPLDLDMSIQNIEKRISNAKTDPHSSARAASAYMHLATLYIDKDNQIALMHAVCYARKSLELLPGNFCVKLLLILLYLKLGSVVSAFKIFHLLDIKQLQLDTISYLISDHILELGDLQRADRFFQESFFIYDDNRTQSWSLIAEAFSRGSYSNIPEFFDFSRRLEYSMQAVACICGTIRTELLTKSLDPMSQYLQELKPEELFFDENFMLNLSDNRDRDVIDFVDHSGNARKILLESLPTFGRASIVIYTFLPLFFRALLFDDTVQFQKIHQRFTAGTKDMRAENASSAETVRFQFIRDLNGFAEKYFESDKDTKVFLSQLSTLVSSNDHFESTSIPTYETLCSHQWKIEREHWLCLTVAFLLKGVASKLDQNVQSISSNLIKSLEKNVSSRKLFFSQERETLLQRSCPIEGIESLWKDLTLSWDYSLKAYSLVCEKSAFILGEASNLDRRRSSKLTL